MGLRWQGELELGQMSGLAISGIQSHMQMGRDLVGKFQPGTRGLGSNPSSAQWTVVPSWVLSSSVKQG